MRKSLALRGAGPQPIPRWMQIPLGESKLDRAKALTRVAKSRPLHSKSWIVSWAEGADRLEVTKAKAAAHQRLGQLEEAERLLASVLRGRNGRPGDLQQLANVSAAQDASDEASTFLEPLAIRHRPPHVLHTALRSRDAGEIQAPTARQASRRSRCWRRIRTARSARAPSTPSATQRS